MRLGTDPHIGPGCTVEGSRIGRYCQLAEGTRLLNSEFGDYSYTDRFADIANAEIGKFSNIASFARIGPTDHPMDRASLHHFLYRSSQYWPEESEDAAFFERRRARRCRVGHDTWIGHMAIVRPEVTVGDGAVVAMGAIVTRDVAPYTVVAGVPAKPVKRRHSTGTAERLVALAWWDWDHHRLRAALPDFRALSAEAFLEKYG